MIKPHSHLINLLLVNETLLMGNVIAAALEGEPDINIVGCVISIDEALNIVREKEVFASFSYLLSGGLSRPALYPGALLPAVASLDRLLSNFPALFGARCLVVLERAPDQPPGRANAANF